MWIAAAEPFCLGLLRREAFSSLLAQVSACVSLSRPSLVLFDILLGAPPAERSLHQLLQVWRVSQ